MNKKRHDINNLLVEALSLIMDLEERKLNDISDIELSETQNLYNNCMEHRDKYLKEEVEFLELKYTALLKKLEGLRHDY